MSISGDPTVALTIQQFYLGGPFPNLAATGFVGLSDGNGDGIVSLTDAFIRTTVTGPGIVGSLVSLLDLNCVATGQAFFQNAPCPSPQAANSLSSGLPQSLLQMDINFTLSDFDTVTLNGSSVLSAAAAAPEPATGTLFAVGFLAFAGFTMRRKRAQAHSGL